MLKLTKSTKNVKKYDALDGNSNVSKGICTIICRVFIIDHNNCNDTDL